MTSAQTHHFRNYSVEHGLPFIQVSAIFQDSKGNLWSGAYGGLSKYDGIAFQNFGTKNGLVNHSVTTIAEDHEGNLWIGTIDGLSKYDGKKFTNYSKNSGLSHNFITSLLTDADGKLWIGTKSGLNSYYKKHFEQYFKKDGLINNTVHSLAEDNRSRIWIGTEKGISLLNKGTFENYPSPRVSIIKTDKKGTIWFGTEKGVTKYLNNSFEEVKIVIEGTEQEVLALNPDNAGNIWIGTKKGLVFLNENGQKKFTIRKEGNANNISSLLMDYEDNLWIGTHSGLYKYRSSAFVSYLEKDGLKNSFIYQITRDKKGVLWFGSENGLQSFDGNTFRNYGADEGLAGLNVSAVTEYKGELWLGTNAGISSFNGTTFKNYGKNEGAAVTNCLSIEKDKEGNLWFGGKGGVTKYNGKIFRWYSLDPSNTDFTIAAIHQDSKGDIWFGAYQGGLYKYNGSSFKEMSRQLGINTSSFMSIVEDNLGNLYFGTFGGVFIYNGKTITTINESKGLNSDLVYIMQLHDDDNTLLVGSNQGLNRINLKAFRESNKIDIQSFGKEEGFSGVECNSGGVYKDIDGTIWFGTVNGLIHLNPNKLKYNDQEPKTAITGISLFYKDTLLGENSKLPYDLNSITFNYAGLSLTNPERVRYQYKLEGFEKNWSPVNNLNYATYSNLPPGEYTFKVKASNNEGIWNSVPASFSFSIAFPFWKTWWFWTIALVAFATTLTLVMRYRIQLIKKREREKLERDIQLASNELKALRAQMNPHFVFNSLNSIQHFIMNSDEISASRYLNKFAKLIRIILNNSEKPVVSIKEEIEGLKLYLELEALRFDNKFSYNIKIDEKVDIDNYELPAMLIQPYVENAILHGLNPKSDRGNLLIDIKEENNFIVCRIQDDGIGRKMAGEIKRRSINKNQRSLGTKITTDRLSLLNQLHNSNLSVNVKDLISEDSKSLGTEVEIFIPLS